MEAQIKKILQRYNLDDQSPGYDHALRNAAKAIMRLCDKEAMRRAADARRLAIKAMRPQTSPNHVS